MQGYVFCDPVSCSWPHVIHQRINDRNFEIPRWLQYSCALLENCSEKDMELFWRLVLVAEDEAGKAVGGYYVDTV